MPDDIVPSRHTRLFEFIRQKDVSEENETRLRNRGPNQISRGDAMMLQSIARASFRKQRLPNSRGITP